MKVVLGWHFAPKGNRLTNGDKRKIILNEALRVEGEIVPCRHGLHYSESAFDALGYAQGPMLWRIEDMTPEERIGHGVPIVDKYATRERKAIAGGKDASALLSLFARQCALDVIHLWDAPQSVREFLITGDESKRAAAWDAARAAACAAAWDAARAAARAAAWAAALAASLDAAWAAARTAAWAAARAASLDAAWAAALAASRDAALDAARDAAEVAQRTRFEEWCLAFVTDGTMPTIVLEERATL